LSARQSPRQSSTFGFLLTQINAITTKPKELDFWLTQSKK